MNNRLPAAAALVLAVALLLPPGASPAVAESAAQQRRVLVLDVELFDTSGEGEAPGHPARLAAASGHLRDLLNEADGLEVVTAAGETPRIRTCNGCEVALARQAEADFVVTGLVRKVSTLLLSITLTVRDARSGAVVAEGVADIRGDSDRSWLRGIGWLVEHRLLAPPPPTPPR